MKVNVLSLLVLAIVLVSCSPQDPMPIEVPANQVEVSRGQELARGLAACGFCHGNPKNPSDPFAGGRVLQDQYGEVLAANITTGKTGIGGWSTSDLMNAIRHSIGREGNALSLSVHSGFEWLSDDDTIAILAFLNAQNPVENVFERRELGTIEKNTTGIFDSRRKIFGYNPSIEDKDSLAYGRYLTEHVARCSSCHGGGDDSSDVGYLRGGDTVESSRGEVVVPSLLVDEDEEVSGWTHKQFAVYLSSGISPDGRVIDSELCPTSYYRNASKEDVEAIATYLVSLQRLG